MCLLLPCLSFSHLPCSPSESTCWCGPRDPGCGSGDRLQSGSLGFSPQRKQTQLHVEADRAAFIGLIFHQPCRSWEMCGGGWGGGRSWIWLPGYHLCTEVQLEVGGWTQGHKGRCLARLGPPEASSWVSGAGAGGGVQRGQRRWSLVSPSIPRPPGCFISHPAKTQ